MKGVCWAQLSVLPCFTARPLCTVIRAVDSDVMTWGETTAGKGEREKEGGSERRLHGWKTEGEAQKWPCNPPPHQKKGRAAFPAAMATVLWVPHTVVHSPTGGRHRGDAGDLAGGSSGGKSAQAVSGTSPPSFSSPLFHLLHVSFPHVPNRAKERGEKALKYGEGALLGSVWV